MKTKSPSSRIKELFSGPKLPSLLVITSPDSVRRSRALQFIIEQLANQRLSHKSFAFSDMHKESVKPFLSELREPSLFDPHRVGLIRNIEKAKAADIDPVTKCIAELPQGVTLLLVGADLPNSQAFKKGVAEYHVAFEPLKGAELSRWTEREFSLQGIQGVSDTLVEYIIAAAEEDPDKISSALEKYTLYLNGEDASISTLQNLFPSQLHASDFELAESILNAPRAKTEVLLQRLLSQGSSPFMLMGLLGKTWLSLSGITALSQKGLSSNEIRSHLGISPWLFTRYLPLAKRLTPELAAKGTEALLKADLTLKDRSLGPAAVFSELAQKLKSFQK